MSGDPIRRTVFILRIWSDRRGRVWGHLAAPRDEQRTAFTDLRGLWQLLLTHLDLPEPLDPSAAVAEDDVGET